MSFSLSISLFFVVAVFYIVIIDVFTMLFRITGLTEEKAKFQVISLLTNSGYSTKESELVVEVLPRRKIARTIMLFGYIFAITIVSVFVNMMLALPASEQKEIWPALIIVCTLFIIFMFVRRIPVVRMAFNSVLERMGRKLLYGNQDNPILLMDEFPRGIIAAVTVNTIPPLLAGKSLKQLQLRDKYGVHVFYIRRDDTINLNISGSTQIQVHDELVVFGKREAIRGVFEATSTPGPEGDVHKAARPETAAEYIHQEDMENAAAAAHQVREQQRRQDAEKAESAAASDTGKRAAAETQEKK